LPQFPVTDRRTSSDLSHAPINEQFDGGDVAAVIGREEDNRLTIIQEAE
jgi:hypothetical protein